MECKHCKKQIPDDAVFCQYCGKNQNAVPTKGRRTRPNGTGTVYKRGNTWVAEVTVGKMLIDGKTHYKHRKKGGFKLKKDAIAYLPVLQNAPIKKTPTVYELWERYSTGPMQKISDSRKQKYGYAIKKWEPLWFMSISDITTEDLQNVVDSKTTSYDPAKDMRDLMSNLFQMAMPDKYVDINLAPFINLPKTETADPIPWNDDEILAFWDDYSKGNTFTGYILLLIYTGMMPGELLDARKDMIDWENRQLVRGGKKTATRKKKPIVLADFIIPVLEDLCNYSSGEKLVTMNKDKFYDTYHETTARIGVRHLPPYSCRHTTATALASAKVSPTVIQEVMRHARFSTTERYIHLDSAVARSAVNTLQPKKEK